MRNAHNTTLKVRVCMDCDSDFETKSYTAVRCHDCQRENRKLQKRNHIRRLRANQRLNRTYIK